MNHVFFFFFFFFLFFFFFFFFFFVFFFFFFYEPRQRVTYTIEISHVDRSVRAVTWHSPTHRGWLSGYDGPLLACFSRRLYQEPDAMDGVTIL